MITPEVHHRLVVLLRSFGGPSAQGLALPFHLAGAPWSASLTRLSR